MKISNYRISATTNVDTIADLVERNSERNLEFCRADFQSQIVNETQQRALGLTYVMFSCQTVLLSIFFDNVLVSEMLCKVTQ